jgi:hypothetical protein
VTHTWPSGYTPGEAVYMLEDGSILRTIKLTFSALGAGGGIQKMAGDGTVLWDFRYYDDEHLSHHDIEPLPNGNVLVIAWDYKTRAEAINNGRDPAKLVGDTLMPDHVIEVKPTGPTSGDIVWEWHVWDHMIQDFDPTKENYGVVGDHPELIDINFLGGTTGTPTADWQHSNSIDYNGELDQILLSVCNFNEIWVIDHSTTTEEAAGHTGGNSGKGGDLLYRWGNPQTYDAGSQDDQVLFSQHDANWVNTGYPGEGNIMIFNNGVSRPAGRYSSVDEITPPVDENGNYHLSPGMPYGPEQPTWIYTSENPTDFYSFLFSSAERLSSGNTLICDGIGGKFIEVNPEKDTIWQYQNIYPNPYQKKVFSVKYIPFQEPHPDKPDLHCEGSLRWTDVGCGIMLNGSFQLSNIGGSESLLDWEINDWPEWGSWKFTPLQGDDLKTSDGPVNVTVEVISPDKKNRQFNGEIKVFNINDYSDYCEIDVDVRTTRGSNYFMNLLEVLLERFAGLLACLPI